MSRRDSLGFTAHPGKREKTYCRFASARCTHDAIDEKEGQLGRTRCGINKEAQNLRDDYFRSVKTLGVHSPAYGEMRECGKTGRGQ
jgi:hypothetical protein